MVRLVEISIGYNHKPEADIKFTLYDFWDYLVEIVHYTVSVREDHTLVAFVTEDASLQLLENFPESIAGVDNVKSKELIARVVKISIGTDHKPEADIEEIIDTFWAHLAVDYTVTVFHDHTFIVFVTEDDSLQLLENVPESIAGVDNVKFEELTPEQYGGDEGIKALLFDIDQSDSDDTSDPADQSEYDDEKSS